MTLPWRFARTRGLSDERVHEAKWPARCTLGNSTYHRERMLFARMNISEDTWDAREGGEKPPLPRNCVRVCCCPIVL